MDQQASRFCTACGNALTAEAKFCISCGAPVASQALPADLPADLPSDQSSDQSSTELPYQPAVGATPKVPGKKIGLFITLGVGGAVLVLILAVVAGVKIFGNHYDTSARTIAKAVGNDGELKSLLASDCDNFGNTVAAQFNAVSSAYSDLTYDYTYGLIWSSDGEEQALAAFDNWGQSVLAEHFGDKWGSFTHQSDLVTDYYTSAAAACNIQDSLDQTIAYAQLRDNLVAQILYPGSWEPASFTQSEYDPNIAYKLVGGSEYTCPSSYSAHTCVAAYVRVNFECTSSIEVTFALEDNNENVMNTTTEYLYNARPGQSYWVMSHYYGEYYPYFNLQSISCG